jgi:hypothetical protein
MHRQVLQLREDDQPEYHTEKRDADADQQQRAAVVAADVDEIERRQYKARFTPRRALGLLEWGHFRLLCRRRHGGHGERRRRERYPDGYFQRRDHRLTTP